MSTAIEWTDTTWNPTTGCDKVSPGCGMARWSGDEPHGQCYAMTMAKRLKGMGSVQGDAMSTEPRPVDSEHGWTWAWTTVEHERIRVAIAARLNASHEQVSAVVEQIARLRRRERERDREGVA